MAEYKEKFLVINGKDLKGLTPLKQAKLGEIMNDIEAYRSKRGTTPEAKYYVCNQDEPYAQQVIDIILQGETTKEDLSS